MRNRRHWYCMMGFIWIIAIGLKTHGFSQITIDSNEYPSTIGIGWIHSVTVDESESGIPVDVGPTGGPQTWTFSDALFTETYERTVDIVDPALTTHGALFPTSDHAGHLVYIDGEDLYDFYSYMDKTSTVLFVQGMGGQFGEYAIVGENVPHDQKIVFPAAYEAEWTSDYTIEFEPIEDIVTVERIYQDIWTIDAWGTIILPIGTFDCLRAKLIQDETENTYFGGSLLTSVEIHRIAYYWYVERLGLVAIVTSQDNETDPNFTKAKEVAYQKLNTSVDEHTAQNITSFLLDQNFPNPFNPETSIHFYLPEDSEIRLDILDLSGRCVTTLVSGRMGQGDHTVHFDAKELPSGIYLYCLNGDGIYLTRRMVLMK